MSHFFYHFADKIRRAMFHNLRGKRCDLFYREICPRETDLLLDLGCGCESILGQAFVQNRVISLDILAKHVTSKKDGLKIVADARFLPFKNISMDIVFSNSVIEHVEDHSAYAAEIRRVCKKGYFIQTPNRHFPIESHYFLPFFQYLPKRFRRLVDLKYRGSLRHEEIKYAGKRELEQLFPEAKIIEEKCFGLTKSFFVVHRRDYAGQDK